MVDTEGRRQVFVYVHPDRCTAANGWVSGWYYQRLGTTNIAAAQFKLGSSSTYWANAVQVPYGQGFGVYKGTAKTSVVFSGAVPNSDAEITAANNSGYSWTGNAMPIDYKLKDFALKESQIPTAVQLYFLSKTGATMVDSEERRQVFVFVHPDRCTAANGWVSGWYYQRLGTTNIAAAQFKLGSESSYWANEVEVPAGQGFGIYKGTATTTLVIPSPIADAE